MKTEETKIPGNEAAAPNGKFAELNDELLDAVIGGSDILNELKPQSGISCDSDLKEPAIVIPGEKGLEPGSGTAGGGAGVLIPEGSSLIIIGKS